jgi:hypothetical protein
MRDTFYCWLYLAVWMSMFFGAAVARASTGQVDWYGIVMSAAFGVASIVAAIQHYRKRHQGAEQDRKE